MFAKLAKLEHKLGHIEIEDLQNLDVDSSDSFYAEILDIFLDKYAQSFKIRDLLGERRDLLVLTLMRKLELMTEGGIMPRSPLKLKVLQNICDSIRVCLRDPLDLKANQTQHLLMALLHIILHFQHYGRALSLSAARCLVNALNKHPDRIQVFISWDVQGYNTLNTVIQNDEATSTTSSSSLDSSDSESKRPEHISSCLSAKADSKDMHESKDSGNSAHDLSLVSYCVKVLHMILCQSEEAQRKLRGNVLLIRSALHRLARCVLFNHQEDHDMEVVSLKHFPYSESNATLFIDLCKLLYILDAFSTLEEQVVFQQDVLVHPSSLLVNHVLTEHVRYKQLFRRVEVQSVDEISIRWQRAQSASLSAETSLSFSMGGGVGGGGGGGGSPAASSAAAADGSGGGQSGLVWNPLSGLPALELMQSVLLIVLTISPIYLELQYCPEDDINANNYYVGKLADCEDCALQLLLLASDSLLVKLFDSSRQSSSASVQTLLAVQSMLLRKKCLPNSFVRVLNRTLLAMKQIEPAERCAVLTPVLIVLSKLVNKNREALATVKLLVFPNPVPSEFAGADPFSPKSSGSGANRVVRPLSTGDSAPSLRKTQSSYVARSPALPADAKSSAAHDDQDAKASSGTQMDPKDCPPNTLRFELIKLMTSLDAQIKRVVAEFVFSLCNHNTNEFVYRTGFGNSVALLQLKGLV